MEKTIKLTKSELGDFPRLLEVWESSVRATHDFLVEKDVIFLKDLIQEKEVFSHTVLTCARNSDDEIIGFIGVSEDSLDMLFIHSAYRGLGIGKALLLEALSRAVISKVDVNEQNEQAIGFYRHFGFVTVSRSETDGFGNPFPILHMQRV